MDIYWIEDKKRKGPVTVPDIIARVQMGELNGTTRAWHKGCEGWMPLKDLPAMADFASIFDAPPETQFREQDNEPETDKIGELLTPNKQKLPPLPSFSHIEEEKSQLPPIPVHILKMPSAFSRFVARMTDYSIFAAINMVFIYLMKMPYNEFFLPSNPTFWLSAILTEAVLQSQWGNTPGKWLMGIKVISIQQNTPRLPFAYALSRSFGVFIFGMGCCISLIAPFTLAFAYHACTKGNLSLWDKRAQTLPVSEPHKQPYLFVCLAIIFISFFTVSYCLTPWLPEMLEQARETAPEWMLRYLPTEIPEAN